MGAKARPEPHAEIVIATVTRLTRRGDVEHVTITIAERDRQWDVWIAARDDPRRLAVAVGLPTREAAEIEARRYADEIARQHERIIADAMRVMSEQMALDEYSARALLSRMTREPVAFRRGWIVSGIGFPDIQMPRCEHEAQAAYAIVRAFSERLSP